MPDTPSARIVSPCVNICVMDQQAGLCLGCHRSIEEIIGWAGLGDDQRLAIMQDLPARKARLTAG